MGETIIERRPEPTTRASRVALAVLVGFAWALLLYLVIWLAVAAL